MNADPPDDYVTNQLLAFVEATSEFVGVVDDQSRVRYLNQAARKYLGVGDATDLTTADLFPPQTFARYYEEIRPQLLRSGVWHGVTAVRGPGDEVVPMAMTIVATTGPGGEVSGLVTQARAIAPETAFAGDAMLTFDELTDLPTRAVVNERIRAALGRADRAVAPIAVIVADVDGLKDVNDSFGHAVGDEVLRGFAQALSASVRSSDTVGRMGGDEFVVLVDGLEEVEVAADFVHRLCDSVSRSPIETSSGPLLVTASFGVAVGVPDDSEAAILQRADAAMYRAKAAGPGKVVMFDDDTGVNITTLGEELAVAVSHGLIRPHVQPIVDLHRGVLVGYQGVARWEHPRRGLLEAEQFVPVLESMPILPVVDLAVLRRTVAAAARAARGGPRLRAYGHLSRRLIGDVGLVRYLTEIVGDLGVEAADVCVEIPHAFVARPSRRVEHALRDLRDVGVRTVLSAVDGECEVQQIVEHGFDELRLARRLVLDAEHDATRRRVADATIALARALGLTVIAVGIETDAQRVAMRDAGCDFGQGNLFGPVQPAGNVD